MSCAKTYNFMDYETKLILRDLIEAIEKLDNPDWWTIILTIINIAAFIFVAITQIMLQKQQTKLQEQQTKSQEYDLYRGLYRLFWKIHNIADSLVFKIYTNIAIGGVSIYTWAKLREEIELLQNELDEKSIDVQLKFPDDIYRCAQYKFLLSLMSGTINRIEMLDKAKLINAFEIKDINMTLHNINKTENEHINLIKTAITDCDEKSDFISSLISVPILRKEVCDSAFLDKIKAKI